MNQQMTRVQTGIAPDGQLTRRPNRSTKFDSPEAELEAVGRAKIGLERRVVNGQVPPWDIDPNGVVRPHRETVVVGGRPDGYGSGVEVQRDAGGHPLPGRPVQLTAQDANACVVLEWNPANGRWDTVTQYPTHDPVTP